MHRLDNMLIRIVLIIFIDQSSNLTIYFKVAFRFRVNCLHCPTIILRVYALSRIILDLCQDFLCERFIIIRSVQALIDEAVVRWIFGVWIHNRLAFMFVHVVSLLFGLSIL